MHRGGARVQVGWSPICRYFPLYLQVGSYSEPQRCRLHRAPEMQAALSLLEAQHIQSGHAIVIDAWCRQLVTEIPRVSYNARVALLEASWSYSHVPELRVVSLALLETWPGRIPSVLAEALHRLSEDAFKKLPKLVRWKSPSACILNAQSSLLEHVGVA